MTTIVVTRGSGKAGRAVVSDLLAFSAAEACSVDTLLAIDKARSRLGYKPAHSWRDTVRAGWVPAGASGSR
jgi:hypothetical protein